jgi:hypothetical protein
MGFWEVLLERALYEGAVHPAVGHLVLHFPINTKQYFPPKRKSVSSSCMLMSFQNKELFQPVIMYLLLGDSLQYFEGIQPEYISLE